MTGTSPMTMNELTEYLQSAEQTKRDLEDLEWKLAKELGIRGAIRQQLLTLSRKGQLRETPLVSEWQYLYTVVEAEAE